MKISEAREHYAACLKEQGASKRNIGSSLCFVRRFEEFLKQRGVEDIDAVTTELLEGYKAALRNKRAVSTDRPLLPFTIEGYLSGIRRFFERAVAKGWASSNPCVGIFRGMSPRRPVQSFLTPEEMARVLSRPDTALPIGLRDRLILELMCSTGIRMDEVLDLDISDVDLEKNRLHIKASRWGSERTVPFTPTVRDFLTRYLKDIRPVWDHLTKRGRCRWRATALFYSPRHGPMSENILEKMVGDHVRAVRPSVPNAGQAIRRACAVRLLSNGASVAEVNALLGQLKMSQTMAYIRDMTEDQPNPC
jgi:integrase/recombinase XerD